jgi:hypothetical protein
LQQLPALFPSCGLRLRHFAQALLAGQCFRQFLPAALGFLPVLPFAIALLQPGGGFGGEFKAGSASVVPSRLFEFG